MDFFLKKYKLVKYSFCFLQQNNHGATKNYYVEKKIKIIILTLSFLIKYSSLLQFRVQ